MKPRGAQAKMPTQKAVLSSCSGNKGKKTQRVKTQKVVNGRVHLKKVAAMLLLGEPFREI